MMSRGLSITNASEIRISLLYSRGSMAIMPRITPG